MDKQMINSIKILFFYHLRLALDQRLKACDCIILPKVVLVESLLDVNLCSRVVGKV